MHHQESSSFQFFQDSIKAPLAMSLQKDSEFRECFNYKLQKMIERGIINNELLRIGTKYNKDFRQARIYLDTLSIINMKPIVKGKELAIN